MSRSGTQGENLKMDKKTIDTVVFDIGGVLVELGRFRFLEKKGFTGEKANRVMYASMRSRIGCRWT